METTLEARLKALEDSVAALQSQLAEKDRRIEDLEDYTAICNLQCAYGYYLEHWMSDEIIALFADRPETSATFVEGTYLGIEGVRRYFGKMRVAPPDFLHLVMQVSPVITIYGGGPEKRAKGRWYGFGTICGGLVNGAIDPTYMAVIYEMEYIKKAGMEDTQARLPDALRLRPPAEDLRSAPARRNQGPPMDKDAPVAEAPGGILLSPDVWAPYNTQYGSGYIYPMHFVHPVTGKPTQENEFNARLNLKPSPFLPKK
jgi:hypothetical protein